MDRTRKINFARMTFAGHWAHNANLSVKAIMGVAGYSEMARMLGIERCSREICRIAKKMAVKWEEMANEGDHYRLAFDRKTLGAKNITWFGISCGI